MRYAFVSLLIGFLLIQMCYGQEQEEQIRIALASFQNNTGDVSLEPYQKGLTEAISTFIAQSNMVQLVERNRLEDALNEQLLAQTGFLDERSAAEVGRIVGAQAIILGSFLKEGGLFQVNARMIDTESGRVLTAEQATHPKILQAADLVAVGLLRQLGIEVVETKKSAIKRIGRWVFLGMGVSAGFGSLSAKNKADNAYARYENSVIAEDIAQNFKEAEDKDSQSNLLAGVSIASSIVAVYFYLSSRQPDRIYRRIDKGSGISLDMHSDLRDRGLVSLNWRF